MSRTDIARRLLRAAALAGGLALLAGCRSVPPAARPAAVPGDEIIVAGERFHTGTRVVTWLEPGGYDGRAGLAPFAPRAASESPRGEAQGWTLPALRRVVDQCVLHYDVCGVSRVCYRVLHERGLGVHFLLDVDGTIYQTLDVRERAPHATVANDRSIGIEIANIGAYAPGATAPLDAWYQREPDGGTRLTIPARIKDPGILTPGFIGRPARPEPIAGTVQGRALRQYDFTPEQYAALARLTAALCRVFPRLRADYPHTFGGAPITAKLPDRQLARFRGILGHFHLQENKIDPGPAFQWEAFRAALRRELR